MTIIFFNRFVSVDPRRRQPALRIVPATIVEAEQSFCPQSYFLHAKTNVPPFCTMHSLLFIREIRHPSTVVFSLTSGISCRAGFVPGWLEKSKRNAKPARSSARESRIIHQTLMIH